MHFSQRAKTIKMIIFDVDGVMTDGKILIGSQGELCKSFDAQDGLGITLLRLNGIIPAIITGRESSIVRTRANELKIEDVFQGAKNKREALALLQKKYHLSLSEIAYVGDDLIDIPVMQSVGFACAVDNARPEVKGIAHFVSDQQGGNGAIRQIAELILQAQGKWENVILSYFVEKQPKDIAQ